MVIWEGYLELSRKHLSVFCYFFGSWLVRWWVDPLRRPILVVVGEAVCGCLGLDSCWPRVQSVGFDPSGCGCRARPFNHPVTVELFHSCLPPLVIVRRAGRQGLLQTLVHLTV